MPSFEKLTIRGADYMKDTCGQHVLHVDNPHALIQAIGYLKFRAKSYERVFLRGQSRLYETLSPSLYRGINSTAGQSKRHKILNQTIEVFRKECSVFEGFPEYAHEALLQHYGIHTTWIDVVDNVWVALWFSAYQAFTEGKNGEFLHFDQRIPDYENRFGYILLLSVNDDRRSKARMGMMLGRETELIDLRIAAPSLFLRPHSQHGLLLRAKGTQKGRILDYSNSVKGVIRYNLIDAIKWLGEGNMVGVRGLFPPPYYDPGYRILLSAPHTNFSVGSINHIGA
jgi:FRG domain-containing protein